MAIKNLKKVEKITDFVRRNFPDATEKHTHNGVEFRFLCPFCDGGRTSELSFDLNPETGACQCWRASCGWKSSVEWFIKHYLNVSYERATEIVGGGNPTSLEEMDADLQMLQNAPWTVSDDLELEVDRVHAWVDGSIPIEDAPLRVKSDVYNWLENDRGYDFNEFEAIHDLYIPPEYGAYKGRVLFEVRSGDELGYLLYAYDPGVEPKTLNPSGKVLSRLIYQYDKIKSAKTIFICEGLFDAARILSFGFFATCIFGTNIGEYQKYLLSETSAKEICVCLDHGAEGAAEEIAQELAEFIPDKRISIVPINKKHWQGDPSDWKKGMDPDDLDEDQFVKYYSKRKKILSGNKDKLALQLYRLKKRSN